MKVNVLHSEGLPSAMTNAWRWLELMNRVRSVPLDNISIITDLFPLGAADYWCLRLQAE